MATQEQSGTSALPIVRNRGLEQHLAALGLSTVEEYAQWCAQHGFGARADKHWHQRCKERYFAFEQAIQSRCARKKQEAHHSQTVIQAIANNELTVSDLTSPHLKLISEAFASLEGDPRHAFLRLLLHVQRFAKLLVAGPVVRQFGVQPGNTFIEGLSALARHYASWRQPPEQWQPRTHNSLRQFSSLARHLLARYPPPDFMDSVWFKGHTPEAIKQQEWFMRMGNGESPRYLDHPIRHTKRMVHHFLHTPSDFTVEAALRRAQVLGLGGSVRLAEAILGSKMATDFDHEDFWISVVRWFIANPMLDTAHVGPIVDYIRHQRFEPQQVVTAPGRTEARPPQPDFSMKGRTPASVLRQVQEWHGDLRKKRQQPTQAEWYESGIGPFEWTEGSASLDGPRRWTIKELVTWKDLFGEGCAMRHCVASYEHACASGQTSIWSMGIERNNGRRKRVLTIEVGVDRKVICQARGKANRPPTEKEMGILRRWAVQEGLTVDDSVRPR